LTVDRYLSYLITQGSITADTFETFVAEQVLLHSSPYPGLQSVLILDNASIYKSKQLRELCKQYGVLLRFLLLYLPDFNPIEATFKDIKAWIKRNHRLVEQFESFEAFLHFAVSQVSSTHAKQHFKEAGYIVN
jgi:hypothetical protein